MGDPSFTLMRFLRQEIVRAETRKFLCRCCGTSQCRKELPHQQLEARSCRSSRQCSWHHQVCTADSIGQAHQSVGQSWHGLLQQRVRRLLGSTQELHQGQQSARLQKQQRHLKLHGTSFHLVSLTLKITWLLSLHPICHCRSPSLRVLR